MYSTEGLARLWSDALETHADDPGTPGGADAALRTLAAAPLEAVARVARELSAGSGTKLPAVLFGTVAASPAAAALLLESLTEDSPLRRPPAERLLTLRAGRAAGVVLAGPSEPSLLLLRDLANELLAALPDDVGLYAVGCYDPYGPGWRRPLDQHARRLSELLAPLPAGMPLLLVGYSAAGLFAHAAALSLVSLGRDVSVILLDTYVRQGFPAVPRTARARVRHALTGLIVRLPDAAGRRLLLPRERRRAAERAAIGLPAATEGSLLEWLRSRTLSWHYAPQPGRFRELLVTTLPSERMLGDPLLGWGWVRQDEAFAAHRLPGNHRSMLVQPYLAHLVADVLSFAGVAGAPEQGNMGGVPAAP